MRSTDFSRAEYSGQGDIWNGREQVRVKFDVVQRIDGRIQGTYELIESEAALGLKALEFPGIEASPPKGIPFLEGRTEEGWELVIRKGFLSQRNWKPSTPFESGRFIGYQVKVVDKRFEPASWRFPLVNFPFVSSQPNDPTRPETSGFGSRLAFSVEGRLFEIQKLDDYKETIERLKNEKGVAPTSVLRFDYNSGEVEDSVVETVDIVCRFLSFTSCNRVNWIWCELTDLNGNLVKRIHRSSVTAGFSGQIGVVDNSGVGRAQQWIIENCYNRLNELEERWDLGIAMWYFVESYVSGEVTKGFIFACIAIEVLVNSFRQRHPELLKLLNKAEKKELKKLLRNDLKNLLHSKEGSRSEAIIKNALRNEAGFRETARHMFCELGVKNYGFEFVNKRGQILHTGRLWKDTEEGEPEETIRIYRDLQDLLARTILVILGYIGAYFPQNKIFITRADVLTGETIN